MILSSLDNIELKSNVLLSSDHNFSHDVLGFDLYQAIFNECKKNLLNKEIKFDNISTKKKKKDNQNITSINFLVNNLLNVFNKKNIKSNFYIKKNINVKTQKKKIDKNLKLKFYSSSKNKNKIDIEENREKIKIFKNNATLKNLINIKNKYFPICNDNIINYFKKFYKQSNFSEINNLKVFKNKKNSIKESKDSIFFKNHTNNTSNTLVAKNIYKNQNFIYEINSLKKIDKSHFFELNKKSMFFLNNEKSVQWKKAISQQILLSISHKENKAEIRLEPIFLGAIHVKIKIKNNQAQLKLISDHIEVKNFLNNCIPFLHNSLIKNGIFLKKVDIYNSFGSKKNQNLSFSKNIPRMSNKIKKFYENSKQKTFIDMYV